MTATTPPDSFSLSVFGADQLYTVAQVVERTQLSRASLYTAMKAGSLPYLKYGETRRLVGRDLNLFLAQHYRAAAH